MDEMFEKGLAVRREVLGADYVDASIAAADDFMGAFQHCVTSWCWGYTWARPGLDRKTRSMLNLAMLTALNRPKELRLHMRAAIRNGVTKQEFVEVFLQTLIYCGAPAANDSFRMAAEVWSEVEAEQANSQ